MFSVLEPEICNVLGLTRLKSRCLEGWDAFSSGGLTREGSTIDLPQVLDRIYLVEAVELMEVCFFKSRNGE